MAITSRDMRSTAIARRVPRPAIVTAPRRQARTPSIPSASLLAYPVVLVLMLVLANAMLSPVIAWGKIKIDDMRYGRPRTVQMSEFVGHEEQGIPSHFVAMNLDRRVVVMEMPGGDAAKARTIVGPYLFGAGEDLTPVHLRFEDVNGDQRPDMLISVKQEEMVYINDAATNAFRIITAEELTAIKQ